ncbi:heparinase II/III family protein [Bacteroides sp. 51]|uniref:heparinase II/III domain-containing protein n=1 Tax=Bacteroides sp. 51 TaxID=2302938 RepID=UPI0013D7A4FD|nr:heparinase II/III family protein [Bacteroides sp. 51]NDV81208.1 heparinase [Bacteroides sp. 51]
MLLLITLSARAYQERNLLQKQADIQTLTNWLVMDQKWVSYPDYTDRKGWNDFLGDNTAYCIEQGEKYLNYQWQVIKATDYMAYSRTGDRSPMSDPYNANIHAITRLFIAELAEGKGRFLDALLDGVFHVCEMTSWSISAHIVVQRAGGTFPVKNDHVLELVSTDVAATFSWIYYFLHEEFDKITPQFSKRLYEEINERILIPYMTEDRFWWMAFRAKDGNSLVNNWNTWCNSNVLQCFLLLENDPEKLAKAVHRSMVSVDKYINYNKSDGACEEGPSYWGHSAGKLFDYLDLIYQATDGKLSLFAEPTIKNMGEYISRSYVGNGWVVNFADASARERLDYHLIARYGDKVESKEMEEFAAYLKKQHYQPISVERDMLRALEAFRYDKQIDSFASVHPHKPYTWYPETEFCYQANPNLFLATKGGHNDESHNHNDVGTFNLYINNTPLFIDIGVETYTGKTFSKDRYSIWTMQSDYHNLPQINGQQQKYGRSYKASQVKANPGKKTFSLDIAGAYPAEAGVKKWQRTYRLASHALYIEDDFLLDNPTTPNQQHFIVWGKAEITQPGTIRIDGNGEAAELSYNPSQLNAQTEILEVKDPRLTHVWGNELTRITLKASTTEARGTYRTTIKPIKK